MRWGGGWPRSAPARAITKAAALRFALFEAWALVPPGAPFLAFFARSGRLAHPFANGKSGAPLLSRFLGAGPNALMFNSWHRHDGGCPTRRWPVAHSSLPLAWVGQFHQWTHFPAAPSRYRAVHSDSISTCPNHLSVDLKLEGVPHALQD